MSKSRRFKLVIEGEGVRFMHRQLGKESIGGAMLMSKDGRNGIVCGQCGVSDETVVSITQVSL